MSEPTPEQDLSPEQAEWFRSELREIVDRTRLMLETQMGLFVLQDRNGHDNRTSAYKKAPRVVTANSDEVASSTYDPKTTAVFDAYCEETNILGRVFMAMAAEYGVDIRKELPWPGGSVNAALREVKVETEGNFALQARFEAGSLSCILNLDYDMLEGMQFTQQPIASIQAPPPVNWGYR